MGCWKHPDLKSYCIQLPCVLRNLRLSREISWMCVRVWNAAACTWPSFLIWQQHQSLPVEATTLQEMQTLAGLQVAEETLDILSMCRRTLSSPSLSMSSLHGGRARGGRGAETSPASRSVNSLQASRLSDSSHKCRTGRTTALCFPLSLTDTLIQFKIHAIIMLMLRIVP